MIFFFFFQAEDGIRDLVRSRGLGDVYKRQELIRKLYDEKVTVLEQDILKTDFIMLTKHLNCEKVRVIGNIPYYILSLIHISEPTRPY